MSLSRLCLLPLLLAVAVLFATTGRAEATPCDRGYLQGFVVLDERGGVAWDPGDIECVEFFRFTVSTPGGPRTFRGIGDVNAPTLLRRGDIARVEAGARRAAARLADLGDYRINDVTYLVTTLPSEAMTARVFLPDGSQKHGGAAGWALTSPRADRPECPVTLFLFDRFEGDDIAFVVAHETFHCVQNATLTPEQGNSRSSGGLWWGEGSAELFAAHVSRAGTEWNRASRFRRAVEAERPLYAMEYEAAIFFYWLGERRGLGGLMPFLRRMASRPDDAAQRAALRSVLTPAEFMQFAQDFDDGRIRYPGGIALDFGPRIDGPTWSVSASTTVQRRIKPFVISPGWTDYACGTWSNRVTPVGVNVTVRADGASTWTAWPSETDCRAAGRARYRVMAMHTGDDRPELALNANRRLACTSCLTGDTPIDACLVGSWEMTGGGPMEWMKRRLPPGVSVPRDNMGTLRIRLNDDGSFSSESVGIDYQMQAVDGRNTTTGDVAGRTSRVTGYWSARGGVMRACSAGASADATVTARGGGVTASTPYSMSTGPLSGETRYTCNATTFTSQVPMPRYEPMEYRFRRTSPPPSTPR